jgi:prophage regulatory protein
MKVLETRDLRERGIHWTRQHIYRLVKQGRFPKPFKLGTRTNAWTVQQIDEYLKSRIATRDAGAPDMKTARPG